MNRKLLKSLTLFLFFIGIIVLIGWYILNRKSNVEASIPNYAKAIICLDYVNIRNTLMSDYWDQTKGNFDIKLVEEWNKSGLKTPDYGIAYICIDSNSVGLFASFEIENKKLFSKYMDSLENQVDFISKDTNQIYKLLNKGNKFIAYNLDNKLVTFCFGNDPSYVSGVVNDIFNNTNLMSRENDLFKKFVANQNHGLIWFAKGKKIKRESWLSLNFEEGKLYLDGSVFLKKKYQFEETNEYEFSEKHSQAHLYYEGGESLLLNTFIENLNGDRFKKTTNINLDSLVKYSDNSLCFELFGSDIKKDTSIAYEYDENFNKVEIIKLVESLHPQFELRLGNDNRMFKYFRNESCIKQFDNSDIFVSYPFSKIYAFSVNKIRLTTDSSFKFLKFKMENALDAHIDFTEIDSLLLNKLRLTNSILNNTSMSLRSFQKLDSTKIEGRIEFK